MRRCCQEFRIDRGAGGRWGLGVALCLALVALPQAGRGQGISFDNRRETAIPENATLRVGPFYSTATFTASAGYRYTRSKGAGTDYYVEGKRGEIRKDGSEIPVRLAMDFFNYVPLSRHSSIDATVRVVYRHYPLNTQEDDFNVFIPDESATGNLAWDYYITRYLRGTVYERMKYAADYLDTRGQTDAIGGRRYEYFENRIGNTLLWLLSENSNLGLTLERMDLWVLSNEEEFGRQERTEYRENLFYERELIERVVVGGSFGMTQRDYKDKTRSDTTQTDFSVFARGNEGKGFAITDHTTLGLSAGMSTGKSDSRLSTNGTEVVRDEEEDVTTFTMGAALRTQLTRYLAHELSYTRGLRGGFNSSFEEYDRWRYSVDYNRPGVGFRVFSEYNTVIPTDPNESSYEEWNSGVAINVPITTYLTLDSSYTYSQRMNDQQSTDPDAAAEERDDYYTRVARIGSSVGIMKSVKWVTYVQRYERLSDLNELEFTRDTFETRLEYTHRF